ncbi:hypothetical protein RB195_001204 [Necator americanus]|uniref:Uncharacterized protein n=1 Tax=Necator americanus TaxID=51031 RepID=A0ABR1DDU6_NECAM
MFRVFWHIGFISGVIELERHQAQCSYVNGSARSDVVEVASGIEVGPSRTAMKSGDSKAPSILIASAPLSAVYPTGLGLMS